MEKSGKLKEKNEDSIVKWSKARAGQAVCFWCRNRLGSRIRHSYREIQYIKCHFTSWGKLGSSVEKMKLESVSYLTPQSVSKEGTIEFLYNETNTRRKYRWIFVI